MTEREVPMNGDSQWTAVLDRDRRADGTFVYAVRTTGVYCRPTCPSRRAKRTNVEFFGTPAAAEGAGYRPCRRCRPHSASGTVADRSVAEARAFLDRHPDESVSLGRLAREVGWSPSHLQRTFTKMVGISPKGYQVARRRERLKARLRKGETVTQATYGVGYGSTSPVYAGGVTPGAYRRGGRGLMVRYTVVPTAFGELLVAATERGVAVVYLGDSPTKLVAELRRELPDATVVRDDGAVGEWARAVAESAAAGVPANVPLDVQGTAFQRRVWAALRQIPAGVTRTYREVAESIGQPTAARAVARACATNPASVVVPCHRVVRGDGGLAGYRWGLERKRALLAAEGAGEAG
jgi:AraC family transcriptional regulator, regulatory protein of adaptative response / methylated-DNA-[protein]-cysteine methyltransferase